MSDTTYRLLIAGLAAGAIAMALAIIWFSRPPRVRRAWIHREPVEARMTGRYDTITVPIEELEIAGLQVGDLFQRAVYCRVIAIKDDLVDVTELRDKRTQVAAGMRWITLAIEIAARDTE